MAVAGVFSVSERERAEPLPSGKQQFLIPVLAGQGAPEGLLISTAKFTKEARQYAQKQHTTKVVLVDST